MKTKPKFDLKKSISPNNSVYLSKLLDPYTAHIAKFVYNIGLSADLVTLLNFILGMSAVAIIVFVGTYPALVIAAILITLRNIGDTIDGKITRGSGIKSTYGGFSDAVSDWIFFHPAFFIAVGFLTNHIVIGFLCVTGYMSREFTRRIFDKKYGSKATETKESRKISGLVSIVTKYDIANVFWLAPIFLIINQPALIIYAVAIIEYTLLLGEIGFDYVCFFKKQKALEKANTKQNIK
ncbi:hypothetical protein CMI37_26080 [Candidatus Pacearchaeota archaeon]|nr:hypothetical protein [Candidatus Pacearchaeota archaeon]|tara:strand:+ start:19233 stop:19943 length:711 start_codon:yes stop_codon:yes gene_type:complete